MVHEPFISRVKIRNFKSIGHCDVSLGRLTLLVGRNGSGKSNFLDALRFIVDGLETSLDHAMRARGGIREVRRHSTGHPHNFSIEVEMNLPDFQVGKYGFEIGAQPKGGFFVKRESLLVLAARGDRKTVFRAVDGVVEVFSNGQSPAAVADRLYLVTASGIPEIRPVYDALLAMGFYNLNPEQMKEVQVPDAGELLRRDGSNIASVIARLADDRPQLKQRIANYLSAIVPDIVDFERIGLGHRETMRFMQQVRGSTHPWKFNASSMSDGTLRTLGILVATMQLAGRKHPVRLVGVEEPETALHPAAAGALMSSLREGATNTQILLTTHSPDLLDNINLDEDDLLVVQSIQGTTEIGPADPTSLHSIRNHLFTAGELLRMDQLQPDLAPREQQSVMVFD